MPQYRQELATSHNRLGSLLRSLDKQAEAEQQYRQGLYILEKCADDFPAVPQYQIELGGSSCNFGRLLVESGRPSESLAWLDRAIRILTVVYVQDHQFVLTKQDLPNQPRRQGHRLRSPAQIR